MRKPVQPRPGHAALLGPRIRVDDRGREAPAAEPLVGERVSGIGRDPFSMTPEERVLDAYFERYTAYAVDKSRVIVIEFQSRDPDLASRVANSIADGYLVLQQDARQQQAKSAS